MWIVLYTLTFWIFALAYIIVRSQREKANHSEGEAEAKMGVVTSFAKTLPSGLAALFVLFFRPSAAPFYLLMVVGLFFCFLGDIGMEISLLPGIGLFALAQITFTFTFLSQSLALGLPLSTLAFSFLAIPVLLIYALYLIRYLQSSDEGLGKLRIPIYVYTLVISMMLYASFLLWMTSGTLQGVILVIGALSFVISDSLIGVREFHHYFSWAALKVMGTYFLALFLISLNVLYYLF